MKYLNDATRGEMGEIVQYDNYKVKIYWAMGANLTLAILIGLAYNAKPGFFAHIWMPVVQPCFWSAVIGFAFKRWWGRMSRGFFVIYSTISIIMWINLLSKITEG